MGGTAYFYAARASVDTVETALRATYPELATLAGADHGAAEARGLSQVYDSDEHALVVLWRDGEYTCWTERSAMLVGQAELVSHRLGQVLVAVVGDDALSASFGSFSNGHVKRWIHRSDDSMGTPLPEEADLGAFDTNAVRTLWSRFGLRQLGEAAPPFRVLRDIADEPETAALRSLPPATRPWWKVW